MHSWRVLILPFIEEQALYDEYSFKEPWNGPNNIKLLERMPPTYRCPGHGHGKSKFVGDGFTNYQLITGADTVFAEETPLSKVDIADGAEQTVILVDVNSESVEWLRPVDLSAESFAALLRQTDGVTNHPGNVTICAFADCHVQAIPAGTLSEDSLISLTTRAKMDTIQMQE